MYLALFLDSILNCYRSCESCFDVTGNNLYNVTFSSPSVLTFDYDLLYLVEDPSEIFSTIFDSIDIYRLQQLEDYDPSNKSVIDIQTRLRSNAINQLKITNVIFYQSQQI